MANAHRIGLVAGIGATLVHLIANPHYGFFRDELYFIICGMHPQFGYVDQPPLVPFLSAMTQLFGHSLFALRAIPALLSGASVFVTCLLVAELGGGAFACTLAAITAFFCPVLMNFGMKQSTDETGLVLWPLIALFVVRLINGRSPREWLWIGVAAGVAFESKYSIVFFAVALILGLAATKERRIFATPWFAAGCAVALVIAAPNAIWQAVHGFPMIELLHNGATSKNLNASPALYLVQQLLITNLFFAPFWIGGVVWLALSRAYRSLAIGYVALIVLMIVAHGKHYYPANIYPILFAAAGVCAERLLRYRSLKTASLAYAVAFGLVFVPLSLPVLDEAQLQNYVVALQAALHIKGETLATEHGRRPALPSDWADMHGWPELAQTVRTAYMQLPRDERARAVVVASNYGEASAIAFFTPDVPVISGHNQWYLWGTRGYDGSVLLDIAGDCGEKEHLYGSARRVAIIHNDYAMPYENDIPVMLCRGPRVPLHAIWPSKRDYI